MTGRRPAMGRLGALAPLLLLAALATVPTGCIKKKGGAGEVEEEEKDFTVGRFAFRRLSAADEAISKKDYKTAFAKLKELNDSDKITDHERALMWQKYADIYGEKGEYDKSIKALEKALSLNALPKEAVAAVQFNLGQLFAIQGQHEKAVKFLRGWAKQMKGKMPAEAKVLLAQSLIALEQHKEALVYLDEVVAESEGPVDERVRKLELVVHLELKHNKKVVLLLTELVERFPETKTYWVELSNALGQIDDHRRALAVLELAYRQEMLVSSDEIIRLARHYSLLDLPLQAAELLEKEMKAERVDKTPDNMELLANSWIGAREPMRALAAMTKAAKDSDNGELDYRLAQLQMQDEKWSKAEGSIRRALKKGKLSDKGAVYLLLGHAQYEQGKRSAARKSFREASAKKAHKAAGDRWLEVMKREDESCRSGKEPACKLIPGRGKK